MNARREPKHFVIRGTGLQAAKAMAQANKSFLVLFFQKRTAYLT
jgi:hypothetical protein